MSRCLIWKKAFLVIGCPLQCLCQDVSPCSILFYLIATNPLCCTSWNVCLLNSKQDNSLFSYTGFFLHLFVLWLSLTFGEVTCGITFYLFFDMTQYKKTTGAINNNNGSILVPRVSKTFARWLTILLQKYLVNIDRNIKIQASQMWISPGVCTSLWQ